MSDYGNNNGGNQPAPRKKTLLNARRMKLQSSEKNQDGKYATLALDFLPKSNCPHLVVWTNLESERQSRNNGKIDAPFDPVNFYVFLGYVGRAVNEQPGWRAPKISLMDYFWKNKERSAEPTRVAADVFVGKDNEGLIYVSVIAHERPKFKFVMAPNEFHMYTNPDGTPYPKDIISAEWARAWVEMVRDVMPQIMVENFQEEVYGNKGGNNNNRGGYGGNNNGGNNNRSYGGNGGGNNQGGGGGGLPMDDDMPF